MAKLRSAKKDIRRTAKRRARNLATRSALKTYVKKARVAMESQDVPQTAEALRLAMKQLDKAAERGIIHKNQAARRKSRLALAARAVLQPESVAKSE